MTEKEKKGLEKIKKQKDRLVADDAMTLEEMFLEMEKYRKNNPDDDDPDSPDESFGSKN